MFTQLWKKYLPVIILLIKRSEQEEQTVTLNRSDFERAAGGKKTKFSFSSLQINNGRININVKHNTPALEFFQVLQDDEIASSLIKKFVLEFSMNNNFELQIKNNTPVLPEPDTESTTTDAIEAGIETGEPGQTG